MKERIKSFWLEIKLVSAYSQMLKCNSEFSAGYDLYSPFSGCLEAGKVTQIPLGFKSAFTPGWVGIVKDRSSMAIKNIQVVGGVIDSDYRGLWKLCLYNRHTLNYCFGAGAKIAQVVFYPHGVCEPELVTYLSKTKRGKGSFGSTGK